MYKLYILISFFIILFINLVEFKNFLKNFYFFQLKLHKKEKYLNIYIITHKDFKNKLTNSYYKILCDDCSNLDWNYNIDLISSNYDNELYMKKIGYCEGSKIYYIWKNYKNNKINTKYVGFNHYRRIFSFLDEIPNLDKIFQEYDVILIERFFFYDKSIKEQYYENHIGENLDQIIQIIKENFTNYYLASLKTMNMTFGHFCNIFIMKKEDFIEYGNFVFGVLFEFDRRNKLKNDDDIKNFIKKLLIKRNSNNIEKTIKYQRRLEGFLLERLTNVFYNFKFKNKYEIKVIDP